MSKKDVLEECVRASLERFISKTWVNPSLTTCGTW